MTEERKQVVKFGRSQWRDSCESRIQTLQHRFDGAGWSDQIVVEMLLRGRVALRLLSRIKVIPQRIFEARERAVMEEGRLQCQIAQRRSPELVPVVGIASNFFKTEVFVRLRAIETIVCNAGRDLWSASDVVLEVAKHFV